MRWLRCRMAPVRKSDGLSTDGCRWVPHPSRVLRRVGGKPPSPKAVLQPAGRRQRQSSAQHQKQRPRNPAQRRELMKRNGIQLPDSTQRCSRPRQRRPGKAGHQRAKQRKMPTAVIPEGASIVSRIKTPTWRAPTLPQKNGPDGRNRTCVDMLPRHVGGRYPTSGRGGYAASRTRATRASAPHSAVEFRSQKLQRSITLVDTAGSAPAPNGCRPSMLLVTPRAHFGVRYENRT